MKLIKVKLKNGEIDVKFSVVAKAMFIFYVGLVMAHISLNPDANLVFSNLLLIIAGALGGGFMTYGIVMFINDIKESNSLKDLKKRIINNFKRTFK